MNLRNEKDVIQLMESSRNMDEWDRNAYKVKKANDDQYPSFWRHAILFSGLLGRIMLKS